MPIRGPIEGERAVNCRYRIISALALLLSTPALTWGGWPFTADGPRKGSREYYEMHAGDPVGERQQCKYGKLWPPQPRAMGEPLPCVHRFYANHYWPYPYNLMDRADVNAVSNAQITNGWIAATTLYGYHFDDQTNALNSAGLAQLQWIMANVPVENRQAFVVSTGDSVKNSLRVASVQTAVVDLLGDANSLPIALRVSTPAGRPAKEIDAIFKQRFENMDLPVIPYSAPTSTGN
jgi:hypothetical protein